MKILTVLLLLPSLSFANEKDSACELAFNAQIYQVAAERFPMKADSLLDEIDSYEIDANDSEHSIMETLAKKEIKAYQKCKELNSEDECEKAENAINKKKHSLSQSFSKGNLSEKLCQFSDFTEDINDFLEHELRLIQKCKRAKDHLTFIAHEYDLSVKHLKNINELKVEINDLFKIKTTNKFCDVVPLIYSNNLDAKDKEEINCKRMIPRANLIIKLQKKCSKK